MCWWVWGLRGAPQHNQTLISLQELRSLLTLQRRPDLRAIIINLTSKTNHLSLKQISEVLPECNQCQCDHESVVDVVQFMLLDSKICNWSNSYWLGNWREG